MSDELLPCPFCGTAAQLMIESSYYMGGCPNEKCGAGGLMHVERDEAVAAWNRRTADALDARPAWPPMNTVGVAGPENEYVREYLAVRWPSGEQAAEQLARAWSRCEEEYVSRATGHPVHEWAWETDGPSYTKIAAAVLRALAGAQGEP